MPPWSKTKAILLLFLSLLGSLVDVFGLAAVVPILVSAIDPSFIISNDWFATVYAFFPAKYTLVWMMLCVVAIFALRNVYIVWLTKKQASFAFNLSSHFSEMMLRSLISGSYERFKQLQSGQILSQAVSVPDAFSRNIVLGIALLVTEITVMLIIVVGLLWLNPLLLLLVAVSVGPAFVFFFRVNRKRVESLGTERQILGEQVLKDVMQLVNGYIDVKLSGGESYLIERFAGMRRRTANINATLETLAIMPNRIVEVVAILGVGVIFCYAQVVHESFELLKFLSLYIMAAYRIMPSANRLMNGFLKIKTFGYTVGVLENTLFQDKEEWQKHLPNDQIFSFNENIKVQDLSFDFEGKAILNNINFTIAKGDFVGISGESGEGKSTLLNLMIGLYKPLNGVVMVDQKPITNNIRKYQAQCGFVKQDVFMLEGSIAHNIAFGAQPIDEVKLMNTIEKCALQRWINQLEKGVYTSIEEGGKNISGGQKQRIGIARAIYRNAQILFLDEPTSSLDQENEAELMESLSGLAKAGTTIIMVSHSTRLRSYFSKELVLRNGRVTE